MIGIGSGTRVTLLAVFIVSVTATMSSATGLGLRMESGTVLPYETPHEVGNAVGVHLTYDMTSFQFSVGGGLVFPGSRVEGCLITGQVMTQWHPWRSADWSERLGLSPYMSLGLGILSFENEEEARATFDADDSVRWIHQGEQLTSLLGLGITYGSPQGLFLSAEARAVNHTHLALLVGAGTGF